VRPCRPICARAGVVGAARRQRNQQVITQRGLEDQVRELTPVPEQLSKKRSKPCARRRRTSSPDHALRTREQPAGRSAPVLRVRSHRPAQSESDGRSALTGIKESLQRSARGFDRNACTDAAALGRHVAASRLSTSHQRTPRRGNEHAGRTAADHRGDADGSGAVGSARRRRPIHQ